MSGINSESKNRVKFGSQTSGYRPISRIFMIGWIFRFMDLILFYFGCYLLLRNTHHSEH
jgi:hypothetical protein